MELFSRGIPRWMALSLALMGFVLVRPELLGRGPDLCLWKHVFHLTACPACGTTRALAAFFHGDFSHALGYNRNVVVTGPLCLILLAQDGVRHFRRLHRDKVNPGQSRAADGMGAGRRHKARIRRGAP